LDPFESAEQLQSDLEFCPPPKLMSELTKSDCFQVEKRITVVVGSGAVGLLYGSRLLEAERETVRCETETHFICRRDFDHCSAYGIRMDSPDGNYFSGIGPSVASRIHKDYTSISIPARGVDWIICAVKSYSLNYQEGNSFRALLQPMVGENTRILLIMNGLGCERYFREWFGAKSVFVGMAFTCVNRNNPSTISPSADQSREEFVLVNHIAFGALLIGHCEDDAAELFIASSLWSNTKIASKVTVAPSLLRAQWSKLCWNIPFSGLCVALGGVTTDVIANDPDLRFLADKIMKDTISLANEDILKANEILTTVAVKSSAALPINLLDADQVMPYCWNLTHSMGPYKPSTVLDLIGGKEMELEYIFLNPLKRAQQISQARRSSIEGSHDSDEDTGMSDWPHLETVVRQVSAMGRIAAEKRKRNIEWSPTFIM
jgi:2-dehydropantoate 2-reductase